jgi:hypothetical protein
MRLAAGMREKLSVYFTAALDGPLHSGEYITKEIRESSDERKDYLT